MMEDYKKIFEETEAEMDKCVYIYYEKFNSELQTYLSEVRYYSEALNNKKIVKSYRDRWNSNCKLTEMLDFITDNLYFDCTIVLWSVFDLSKADFHMLYSDLKVISILESDQEVESYYKMINNYFIKEKKVIFNHN